MSTIIHQQDVKSARELLEFLQSIEDLDAYEMPPGDVLEVKIVKDEKGRKSLSIWRMFRGTTVDLTENREGRPDWDSDHDIDQHPTSF